MVNGSVDNGCCELSENVWFVWSKKKWMVELGGDVTDVGQTNKKQGNSF